VTVYYDIDSPVPATERIAYIMAHNTEMSAADAERYLDSMIARTERKKELLERRMSNRMAEHFLDRQGWVRPFGWRTVFYYPDSDMLRMRYIFLLVLAFGAVAWWAFGNG
jgi:hypothetical protein